MRKVKQSFFLCFVIIFAITSISFAVSGLHLISSFHKSEETSLDGMKKVDIGKIRDNIEVEIYTALPDESAFAEDASITYPEDIYDTIYVDGENNLIEENVENKETQKKQYIANKLGTFEVKVLLDDEEYISHVIIQDTIAPKLNIKEITINENQGYDANSFVDACQDNSKKECNISFKEEVMSTYKTEGSYDIIIVAKDESGNIKELGTKLIINKVSASTPSKPSNPSTPSTPTPAQPTPTPEPQGPTLYVPSSGEISSVISSGSVHYDTLLNITNEYRAEVGLPPLTLDDSLNRIATLRVIEIAKNNCEWRSEPKVENCFSHTRPDGSNWDTAFDSNRSFHYIGENLAFGQTTAASAMQGWRNSATHYENIVKPEFTKVGFGVINYNGRWYWVQSFGG